MKSYDKKAFDLLRRRIERASMSFSIEVYKAFADAERVMNGEEPYLPASSGVFISRDEARVEESERRAKKASETRRKKAEQPT